MRPRWSRLLVLLRLLIPPAASPRPSPSAAAPLSAGPRWPHLPVLPCLLPTACPVSLGEVLQRGDKEGAAARRRRRTRRGHTIDDTTRRCKVEEMLRGTARARAGARAVARPRQHAIILGDSENRNKKSSIMSKGSVSLVGHEEYLEGVREDSWRIKKEIQDLRSQLDQDVKELGYYEENEKLRVELDLKMKEIQCLSKQNKEMQAKNYGIMKQNEELKAKNDALVKQNEELQAKNDGLVKQNVEPQTNNDRTSMWYGKLQDKNDRITFQHKEMQVNNNDLAKQNKKVQAKNDGLRKRDEKLQAKNDDLANLIEISDDEAVERDSDLLVLKVEHHDVEVDIRICDVVPTTRKSRNSSKNHMIKQNQELQAKNEDLTNQIEELESKNDVMRKQAEEIGSLQNQVTKLVTTIDELMANNRTLAETKEALKEKYDAVKDEVAAYAAELERTQKKNEDLSGYLVKKKRDSQRPQSYYVSPSPLPGQAPPLPMYFHPFQPPQPLAPQVQNIDSVT
ncbi:hypothetical protein BS78_03G065700 [Paspalum vaginatum]|nr:hypothetical protein BS78_03G065700 [Paspalum vaginatum]